MKKKNDTHIGSYLSIYFFPRLFFLPSLARWRVEWNESCEPKGDSHDPCRPASCGIRHLDRQPHRNGRWWSPRQDLRLFRQVLRGAWTASADWSEGPLEGWDPIQGCRRRLRFPRPPLDPMSDTVAKRPQIFELSSDKPSSIPLPVIENTLFQFLDGIGWPLQDHGSYWRKERKERKKKERERKRNTLSYKVALKVLLLNIKNIQKKF